MSDAFIAAFADSFSLKQIFRVMEIKGFVGIADLWLFVPARLSTSCDGVIHYVIRHQEESLQLQNHSTQ